MDIIVELLRPFVSDEIALRWIVVLLAGAIFALFGLGVAYLFFGATDPVRRRLVSSGDQGSSLVKDNDLDPNSSETGLTVILETVLGPVSRYVLPANEVERSKMTQKLHYAGFKRPNALQSFYALKTGLTIGLPLLAYPLIRMQPELSSEVALWLLMLAGGVGLIIPNFVLERLKEKRMKALRNGFPDALDLLVVCVESGLGISQALQRVGNELEVSHPELADELLLVNAEVRAGVDRVTALKNLSVRTGLEDIRGLVSLLAQTLRFGTSVADSLRIYAEEFRDKRMQAAEEQAAKLGTKLIFPLILFLFPAFFVVSVGPAMIKVLSAFGG